MCCWVRCGVLPLVFLYGVLVCFIHIYTSFVDAVAKERSLLGLGLGAWKGIWRAWMLGIPEHTLMVQVFQNKFVTISILNEMRNEYND